MNRLALFCAFVLPTVAIADTITLEPTTVHYNEGVQYTTFTMSGEAFSTSVTFRAGAGPGEAVGLPAYTPFNPGVVFPSTYYPSSNMTQLQIVGTANTPETGSVRIILNGIAGASTSPASNIPETGPYYGEAEFKGLYTACEALSSNPYQCDPNAQYSFTIPVDFSGYFYMPVFHAPDGTVTYRPSDLQYISVDTIPAANAPEPAGITAIGMGLLSVGTLVRRFGRKHTYSANQTRPTVSRI